MNEYFEPRPVPPHRALAWMRQALEMMTRRLPLTLLVSVSVYVVIYSGSALPLPPHWWLGPVLFLPLVMACVAHLYAPDWWFGEEAPPLAQSVRPLLHAGVIPLLLHLSVAAVQWLDERSAQSLAALHNDGLALLQVLLPASLSELATSPAQLVLATRLIEEPFVIVAIATAIGLYDCWFVPLLLRYAKAPPDAAVPLARRAMQRNRWALLPVLGVVLVGARIVGEFPPLAGLYLCFVVAVAAASFRDIFGQRSELEQAREVVPSLP